MSGFYSLPSFVVVFTVLVYVSITAPVKADYVPGEIKRFSAGIHSGYFDYDESGITEEGYLHGLGLEFSYGSFLGYVAEFRGNYSSGELDYDGRTLSDEPRPVETTTDDFVYDFGMRIGQQKYRNNQVLYPYVGVGHRLWRNRINDNNSVSGYERKIRYYYLPLGIDIRPLEEIFGWNQQLRLEYMHFFEGEVESFLSDASSSFPDVENEQDDGTGFRVEYEIFSREKGIQPKLRTFINYWDVDRSDFVNTGVDVNGDGAGPDLVFEPENNTLFTGIRLLVDF